MQYLVCWKTNAAEEPREWTSRVNATTARHLSSLIHDAYESTLSLGRREKKTKQFCHPLFSLPLNRPPFPAGLFFFFITIKNWGRGGLLFLLQTIRYSRKSLKFTDRCQRFPSTSCFRSSNSTLRCRFHPLITFGANGGGTRTEY